MILAAIDIGSNASRILISESVLQENGTVTFVKLNFLRIPLRLGADVFEQSVISDVNIKRLLATFNIYKELLDLYQVAHYKACATSAFREAINKEEVVAKIKEASGLILEVIDGNEEAEIINENHVEKLLEPKMNYLYIDVGGGSSELALNHNGNFVFRKSFDIGTIRLLKNSVSNIQWDAFKEEIISQTKAFKSLLAIGTGGSINKIGSILKVKEREFIELEELITIYDELKNCTEVERMTRFNIKRDKTDLIVPGIKVYIAIMKWANIKKIYVPRIGLIDGIIKRLFLQNSK
ncbi:MAG TPA: hypothetical protein VLZ83_14630 [Edaphocola sp.]|nr:hypothetical protein [Edaphocola sp.]